MNIMVKGRKYPDDNKSLSFAMFYIELLNFASNNRSKSIIPSYLEGIKYMKNIVDINQISSISSTQYGTISKSILDYLDMERRDPSVKEMRTTIKQILTGD